jgi:cell division protein FtsB
VRKIAEAVLVVALLLAVGQAKCAGERNDILTERIAHEVTQRKQSEKRADSLVKRNDSLSATISTLTKAVPQTRTKYVTLRDTLLLQDTGVVPIEVVREVIKAADSLIGLQDKVIKSQSAQIGVLREIVSEKDEQIKSLNSQLRLTVRHNRPPLLNRVASAATKLAIGAAAGAIVWEAVR